MKIRIAFKLILLLGLTACGSDAAGWGGPPLPPGYIDVPDGQFQTIVQCETFLLLHSTGVFLVTQNPVEMTELTDGTHTRILTDKSSCNITVRNHKLGVNLAITKGNPECKLSDC